MARILNLLPWRRHRMARELDRELRYHVDRRIDELRRSGLGDAEARRRAALEFGGVAQVREEVRETWVWRWLDAGVRDLRYACRALGRSRGFTATAVLSLALGVGANTAIFSLVDQVLLRRLPGVTAPERLVHLTWQGNVLTRSSWGTGNLMSYPHCRDLDQEGDFLEGVFCRHPTTVNFSTGQEHNPVAAEIVSGSYFPVLGVRPERGRLIDRSDDLEPGAHPVVVLSHRYWQNHLGGAEDIVGRKVLVDNYPMTVIGIAPESFPGIDPLAVPALWIPAMMTREAAPLEPEWDRLLDRRTAWMHVFGRLKAGVTGEQARAGLGPWFRSMLEGDIGGIEELLEREGIQAMPDELSDAFLASSLDVLPASRGLSNLRGALERPLLVLMGGTALLILLASLNVAGLLLARGSARSRELTTRLALGATRGRIAIQLLVETLLIAAGGGLVGLLAAPAVSGVVLVFLPAGNLTTGTGGRVFLFALLATVVTAGLCGLAPAHGAGRIPLAASLNERSRIASGGAIRFRKALVVAQIAFTLILLMGAGLFVRTLARLYGNAGFPSGNLVMFRADPPSIGHSVPDARRLMTELFERLGNVPGVEGVAAANTSLLEGGSFANPLTIQSGERIVTEGTVFGLRVTPGFFQTLGIPLIAGREFDERDTRQEGADFPSAIVNESFARRYFGDRNPLGYRLGRGNGPDTPTNIEIIGVIEDFSYRSLSLTESEHVFYSFWGPQSEDGTFYIRVREAAEATFASIRAAVGEVDPALPVPSLTTFEDQIDRSLRNERMLATLSSGFGAIALFLSVVGLYGVMSFVVTERTQEIGVRLALGASPRAAAWFVVRGALVMIAAGTTIGLAGMWALRRLVEAQLFGVQAVDGPTIAAATGLLTLVALGAAMLPAWRAASVDPTNTLRHE